MELREALLNFHKSFNHYKDETDKGNFYTFQLYQGKWELEIMDNNFKTTYKMEHWSLGEILTDYLGIEVKNHTNESHPSNSNFEFKLIFFSYDSDKSVNEFSCDFGIYNSNEYTHHFKRMEDIEDLINFIYDKPVYVEEVLQENQFFLNYLEEEEVNEYYYKAIA